MKISEDYSCVLRADGVLELRGGSADRSAAFQEFVEKAGLRFERTIRLPEERVREFTASASERSGRRQPNLLNHLTVIEGRFHGRLPAEGEGSRASLAELVSELERFGDVVESAQLVFYDTPSPALRDDCGRTSRSHVSAQGYRAPPPGLNIDAHGRFTGDGVRVYVCEYGWDLGHEDLHGAGVHLSHAMDPSVPHSEVNHGTGTLGVLVSNPANGIGMAGIAPDAEVHAVARWTRHGRGIWNLATTALHALSSARPGDVVLFEMQHFMGATTAGPAELQKVVWSETRSAVDRGVVVVAAAGNGPIDLDSPAEFYRRYRAYGRVPGEPDRDSGAIIVGAGDSTSHDWRDNSTYGCRVNLQGWGDSVATLGLGKGLGTYAACPERAYRANFSDTSAAAAQVAGVCAVVQQAARVLVGRPLASEEMRQLLIETGTPQGRGERVGPLPDLGRAIEELRRRATSTGS
ncbi:MAG: S8 family serine peptidase [Planctomycetota bacterium JB042]